MFLQNRFFLFNSWLPGVIIYTKIGYGEARNARLTKQRREKFSEWSWNILKGISFQLGVN